MKVEQVLLDQIHILPKTYASGILIAKIKISKMGL